MARTRIDSIYSIIGTKIANFRRNSPGLTQEDLGKAVGLERTSIVLVEQGKQRLPIDRLYRISIALGSDIKDLLPSSDEINVLYRQQQSTEEMFDDHSQKRLSNKEKKMMLEIVNKESGVENAIRSKKPSKRTS
jgi:transcriptional regulator with XRE-family HTH domain